MTEERQPSRFTEEDEKKFVDALNFIATEATFGKEGASVAYAIKVRNHFALLQSLVPKIHDNIFEYVGTKTPEQLKMKPKQGRKRKQMGNSGNYRGDNNDTKVLGADGTVIGNTGDALKVTGVTAAANILISTDNSSTDPIAVSGTFTGTFEDISDFSDIMIMLFTSEQCTLYFDFSTDGSTVHRTITYEVDASVGTPHKLARVAQYGRVRVVNNGGSPANIALQVIYTDQSKSHLTTNISAPINDFSDAELVRAVLAGKNPQGDYENILIDQSGAIGTHLTDPQTAAESRVAPSGPLEVAALVRLVGDNFITGEPLLPTIWNTGLVNGGDITVTDGELSLNTNTTANGEVNIETKRLARFITGTFNLSHHAIALPDFNAADCVREWGCYDPVAGTNNGIFMRNDSGSLSIVRIKNGVEVANVPEGSFNGPVTVVKNDNIHIYEFMYNAGIVYVLQDRKLIHTIGSPSSAAYGTPHLKCGVRIYNKNGNTTANKIISRGLSIGRLGGSEAVPSYEYISAAGTYMIKNTPGKLKRIVIGDKGTAASTITLYDSTTGSGQIIASIDTDEVSNDLLYEVEFDMGLTLVVTGASIKLTVVYD